MWCRSSFNRKILLSRNTKAKYFFTGGSVRCKLELFWVVFKLQGVCTSQYSSWWEMNTVLLRRIRLASACQYSVLAFTVRSTTAVNRKSMHSFIRARGWESSVVGTFPFLLSTQKQSARLFFGASTIGVFHLIWAVFPTVYKRFFLHLAFETFESMFPFHNVQI